MPHPFSLRQFYGSPPWPEILGQKCTKYARFDFALEHVAQSEWLKNLLIQMSGFFQPEERPLVDIRYWSHLEIGDIPGVPGWHYDCFNTPEKGEQDRHLLYFCGAGCRTMFRPDIQPDEGWIIEYGHQAEHQITACTASGPRLLVRLSKTAISPASNIYDYPMVVKPQVKTLKSGRKNL